MASGKPRYGIDGGYIGIPYFAALEACLWLAARRAKRRGRPALALLAGTGAVGLVGSAAGYLYSSGRGKRSVWRELLEELRLQGDETILDIGCGRGAVTVIAAQQVPRGRVTGADIWRLRDQTGNSREAAERNAALEGVGGRVEFVKADARDLPFPSDCFGVVVSSLTFSNIHGADERAKALREAVRVLRPEGKLRIVDDRADRYAEVLRAAGCVDVEAGRLDWRTWFGLPGHHLTFVASTRPVR